MDYKQFLELRGKSRQEKEADRSSFLTKTIGLCTKEIDNLLDDAAKNDKDSISHCIIYNIDVNSETKNRAEIIEKLSRELIEIYTSRGFKNTTVERGHYWGCDCPRTVAGCCYWFKIDLSSDDSQQDVDDDHSQRLRDILRSLETRLNVLIHDTIPDTYNRGDLALVADLKYGAVPELEKQIAQLKEQLNLCKI